MRAARRRGGWRRGLAAGVCLVVSLGLRAEPAPAASGSFGVLQGTLDRAGSGRDAGLNVAVVSVAWDAVEPQRGTFDEAEIARIREEVRRWRERGYRLQLDLGFQYPPAWVFALPGARYRNQFGEFYESSDPGRKVANGVFSQSVRDAMTEYAGGVFARLGTDWDWVRLGGGFFGEVNYPPARSAGRTNCYWAFDDAAQGKGPGRADEVPACPVPGWKPGEPDPVRAGRFLEWYLAALQNYHDWQIRMVRRWFSGDLCVLYGSWGIRPGVKQRAVAGCLGGDTPAERVGEIASGYDWERMIGGISDPRVIVYCTWMDAPPKDCDDDGPDPARWSPVHWQASLAAAHPLALRVWGENTGGGDRDALVLTFDRAKRFGLLGVVWAFERELFVGPESGFATFSDLADQVAAFQKHRNR